MGELAYASEITVFPAKVKLLQLIDAYLAQGSRMLSIPPIQGVIQIGLDDCFGQCHPSRQGRPLEALINQVVELSVPGRHTSFGRHDH